MPGIRGIDAGKGPSGICLVVGCRRKALYRNPTPQKDRHPAAGYCSDHRGMAFVRGTASRDMQERSLEGYLNYFDEKYKA